MEAAAVMAATVDTDGDTHEADQRQPTDHQRVQVRHLGFRRPSWIQAAILDSGGHLGFRRPPPTWSPRGVFLNSLGSQFVCEFIHTYRLVIYSSYNYQIVFQTSNFALFQACSQSSSVVFVIFR